MKKTFKQWMAELHEIATKAGYEMHGGYLNAAEMGYWQEQFEEGLTPQQAWDAA